MSIKRIGVDIVELRRIEKMVDEKGEAFLNRIFTQQERKSAEKYPASSMQLAGHFAKRFAAKEAVAKALGTGFGASAGMHEIEVVNDDKGAPKVVCHGAAKTTLGKCQVHLSLSDDGHYAIAYAIVEAA